MSERSEGPRPTPAPDGHRPATTSPRPQRPGHRSRRAGGALVGLLLAALVALPAPARAVTFEGAPSPAGSIGWSFGMHPTPQLWLFRDDRTATPIGTPLSQRQASPRGVSVRTINGSARSVVYPACVEDLFRCDVFEVPLGGRARKLSLSAAQWSEVAVGAHERWLAIGRMDGTRARRTPQLVVYRDGRPVLRRSIARLVPTLPRVGRQSERIVVTGAGIVWSLWSSSGCGGDREWALVRTDAVTGVSRTVARRCASEADRSFPPGSVSLLGPAGDGVLVATGFAPTAEARCMVTLDAGGAPTAVAAFANPGTVGGHGGRDDAPAGDAAFAVMGDHVHVTGWLFQGYLSSPGPSVPDAERIIEPSNVPLLPLAEAPLTLAACARSLLAVS